MDRLSTGVAGLDEITNGGLPLGGIYLVVGRPGAGKSILGNQIAFGHVARGGRAVYATLLSETHARMLTQIRQMGFFDEKAVGDRLVYLNALKALETDGLVGLLRSVQHMVREQKAELLVLDGLLPPAQLGVDELGYKKFVAALQSWVGVVGCTVVVLRTGATEGSATAEQTMVDGILELGTVTRGMRTMRQVAFTKLRGSTFAEGKHAYLITKDGLAVYPRLEASAEVHETPTQPIRDRVATGTPGLDEVVGGSLPRGSTTLLLGSSGAGKSIMSLQFAVDGARRGEPVVFFGFFEPPHALIEKAERLGLEVQELVAKGLFHIRWHDPAEAVLDRSIHELRSIVKEKNIRRVVLDGFAGLRTADYPERISAAFTVLTNEFSRQGVTTMVTDETRELFVREVEVPTQHVSALFHNILFLRQVELNAKLLRLVGVMKTRDTKHDRRLWESDITDAGMRLVRPYQAGDRGLMTGGKGEPAPRRDDENTTEA